MNSRLWKFLCAVCLLVAPFLVEAKPRSAEVPLDTSAISITEVQPALERTECRNSDFVDVKDLGQNKIVSVDFEFIPKTEEFRGHKQAVYEVQEFLRIDAEFVRALYEEQAQKQVPHGIDDYRLSNFAMSAVPEGTISGSFRVEYQKRASMTGTCYKGWNSWPPYPIFSRCDWITDVNGAHAVGVIHTVGTPRLVAEKDGPSELSVNLASTYEEVERPSELLINIVGFFTFSIGGKYINDTYRGQVSDFRAEIREKSYGPVTLPAIRKGDPNVDFDIGKPTFGQPQGRLQLILAASTKNPLTPSLTQSLRNRIIQAKRFFQSCVSPETEYKVQNGDTLWKIAQNVYGDGQYYQVIATANRMSRNPSKILRPGHTLTLQPYYRLVAPGQVLVQSGDTLWGMAKKVYGRGEMYTQFRDVSGDPIATADRLATLTAIVAPSTAVSH
jgi:hypothetical protein